jgi:hypothetical protein
VRPRKSIVKHATHAGPAGRDDGDFALGKLDLHIHGPQGFSRPYTSPLSGGAYSGGKVMSGFAKAATAAQISPPNGKNWATADTTDDTLACSAAGYARHLYAIRTTTKLLRSDHSG